MPSFDWERFLRARRVDYTPAGGRQVVVHCPFCGLADAGRHMSINLDGKGWRCWRVPHVHFGRAPLRLVKELLRCSEEEAREIVGLSGATPRAAESSVLPSKLARLRGEAAPSARPRKLELPPEFHPLDPDDPRAEPFVAYLEDTRGYRPREVRWLAQTYGLCWAKHGPFAWRLIFLLRGRHGELLTWAGRGIGRDPVPRYKQPKAGEVVCEAPRTLWGLDQLWRAESPRALVVCEGPLDAARISSSGAAMGVWGTCLFGLNMSVEQRRLIGDLAERFPRVAVLLDATAERNRRWAARQLAPLRVLAPKLPVGVDDPGELTAAQATQLCLEILAK